jgi:hypothetical protein
MHGNMRLRWGFKHVMKKLVAKETLLERNALLQVVKRGGRADGRYNTVRTGRAESRSRVEDRTCRLSNPSAKSRAQPKAFFL